MTSGYDGSILNGLQAVQPWLTTFHNPTGSILGTLDPQQLMVDDERIILTCNSGIMSAAFGLGAVIAMPFVSLHCPNRRKVLTRYQVSYTNDKLGRKHSITFGSLIMMVGVIMQTVSHTFGLFLAARFVLGLGIPFAIGGMSCSTLILLILR
jgi:MFS family permease